MLFLATSDLHGNLPIINDEFNLLMITGDICPDLWNIPSKQVEWIEDKLIPWINNLKFKNVWSKIIIVPGNHDLCFDYLNLSSEIREWSFKTSNHLVILNHDLYEYDYLTEKLDIKRLKIFGTPYCKRFGNWAFMVSDNELRRKYSQIPKDIDILLSHDSPTVDKLGAVLDEDSRWYNPNSGNDILSEVIKDIKPKIFHSGHIHSGNHKFHEKDGTWMANVSYVNDNIEPNYKILKYEFYDDKVQYNNE